MTSVLECLDIPVQYLGVQRVVNYLLLDGYLLAFSEHSEDVLLQQNTATSSQTPPSADEVGFYCSRGGSPRF